MISQPLAVRFGQWATSLATAAIPAGVVDAARRAVLDTVGVMTAGRRHPATVKTLAAFSGEAGPCRLIDGGTASPSSASLINGVAAHAWDFDDTSYTGILHGSAIVLPVVLAAAEDTGADDATVLAAYVAGCEVAYALGEIVGHAHYFRGWWSTLTLGVVGATAAAARVYGLDATAGTHAIALAAACAGGGKAVFGTDGKPFLVGLYARMALDLARGARAGLTGPLAGFEDDRGFLALLDGAGAIAHADTLGQRWRLIDPGLLLKQYPVCSAAHAAIEQTVALCNKLEPDRIRAIDCRIPALVHISLAHDDPRDSQEAQFSLPFAVACAVHHGGVALSDLSETAIADPVLRRIMAKVRKTLAPDLSTDAMRARYPESALVVVELGDGFRREGFCGIARGMPGRPLSDDDIAAKFDACIAYATGAEADVRSIRNNLRQFGSAGEQSLISAVRSLWRRNP